MCGVAGEINWQGEVRVEAVEALVAGLLHRGPDDRGVWSSADGVCVLGHTRLSILDLSPAGHQPMVDTASQNVIVFNGEIYNFQALRKQCEDVGDVFVSNSDTEVILALYRRHGVECLKYLRGMFAFGIWDGQKKQLFLARDRIGKKPLNYAITKQGLVFGSELNPLARHPDVDTGLDLDALDLYLQCQFIPAPWTIYQGVRKLPPAHYAIYDRAGLRTTQYWEIDYRNKIRISESDALDAFEEKLREAVRLRMITDVPFGALLSGGVDSSIVVALMARLRGERVRTFSIGFEEDAFNELPWAKEAAERCGTLHHPEVMKSDVEALLPTVSRQYGEPFADHSALPSFMVSAAARRHVTVALNGDGGDELLGGYGRYALSNLGIAASRQTLTRSLSSSLAKLAPRLLKASSLPMRGLRHALLNYLHPELRSVNMYASFWNDPDRGQLLPAGLRGVLPEWRRHWLAGSFRFADNAIDRMLWMDNHTYLPGCLLAKMDIASMNYGLETRSPLLDQEVIEFCASLPVRYKVNGATPKFLLKRLAERYFPKAFVYRPKMGFGMPVRAWLLGPLKRVAMDVLRDPNAMFPLNAAVIDHELERFYTHQEDNQQKLWVIMMYGLWRRSASQ